MFHKFLVLRLIVTRFLKVTSLLFVFHEEAKHGLSFLSRKLSGEKSFYQVLSTHCDEKISHYVRDDRKQDISLSNSLIP